MLINSADFQRQFGKFREMAQREPVTVTSYGRESVVLLSATEYKRLKSQDRRSFHPLPAAENLFPETFEVFDVRLDFVVGLSGRSGPDDESAVRGLRGVDNLAQAAPFGVGFDLS